MITKFSHHQKTFVAKTPFVVAETSGKSIPMSFEII
jgi:hypothetical protein